MKRADTGPMQTGPPRGQTFRYCHHLVCYAGETIIGPTTWKKTYARRARRHRRSRHLATALLAALTAAALVGCSTATPVNPPKFTGNVRDQTYFADRPIQTLRLPAAAGGSGTLIYSLSPDVPGLTFDPKQRTLSGTPTASAPPATYRMTYQVRDANRRTDEIQFAITVNRLPFIGSILSAVSSDNGRGTLRPADVPEPSGGPAVAVSGNHVITSGGAVLLDATLEPGTGADKLLISVDGVSFGYYEVDVQDVATTHRLVGEVRFDLDPALERGCLAVSAVDSSGAVGPSVCHTIVPVPVGTGDVEVTLTWDTDADLDLHVADPNGDEVYYNSEEVASGGTLDLDSACGSQAFIRNEHIGWSQGTPPPGLYEVRVSHWGSKCDTDETNYVVRIYNHGHVTTFTGTFTGPGGTSSRGTGRVITQFTVGGATPGARPETVSSTYRGSGDQVFVLNPGGETLDDTLYTLDLGSAEADVYVIATAGNYHVDPQVEWLNLRDAQAKGLAAAAQEAPESRPDAGALHPRLAWINRFNNFDDGPPVWDGSVDPERSQSVLARPAVATGDRLRFFDLIDEEYVSATVRSVVTDGTTSVAFWVADQEWEGTCRSRGDCVTSEMLSAFTERFLRPGDSNDIVDWVTTVFGAPWGAHDNPMLIPPQAAREIHIFLFDIANDGYPTGARTIGYYSRIHNHLRQPDHRHYQYSIERLAFFMDSPILAFASGETWEVTDSAPTVSLGTLAHEFQHMIHFYQKSALRDAVSESWLNEMASEVAEDLIADKAMIDGPRAVAHDDPTAGEPENRRGRLPNYNLYNDIQVTSWPRSYPLPNYSIVYAFGAYLARNYGGAALFSDIVQSPHAGVGAVEAAVRNQGHDESFLELLTNWAAANLLSDSTEAPVPYQYNTGNWRISSTAGVEYRLGSINLYNYVKAPGRVARPGPFLHPLPVFNDRQQPPHSNMYTTLGRNSGTVRLRVSAESDNRITVVVKE